MTEGEKRIGIVALVIIVILVLFMRRGDKIIYQEADAGNIILKEGDKYEYLVPPLEGGNFDWGMPLPDRIDLGSLEPKKWRDAWDWMQTTNLACACDVGLKGQVFIPPPPPQPQRPTILFQYLAPSAAMNYQSPDISAITQMAPYKSFTWESHYWVYIPGKSSRQQVGRDVELIDAYTVRQNGVIYKSNGPRPRANVFG